MDNIKPNMENYFSNIHMMNILFKWKWHLLAIAVIAALLAAIFSGALFIKPRYKSYALIYPSNIAPYSDESESEQMLQWMLSEDIRDSVMKKFDLPGHYGIDHSYKYFSSTMNYLYSKNVKINKTQWESIEIAVMDTDPVIARDMVLAIIDYVNEKIRSIHREKYNEVVLSMGRILDQKRAQLDSIEAELSMLRQDYELIDFESQAREITRGYLRTVDGSNSTNINMKDVIRLKENFEQKAGRMAILTQRRDDVLRLYAQFEEVYDRAVYDTNKHFTFTNVISPPVTADKKSYPVRWLIVLYAVAAALVFAVVAISVIENKRRILAENTFV